MNNAIIYDYLTFTSKIHSHYYIIELLGLENVSWEQRLGFYGYRDCLFFENIRIHYNGREDMGVCVEMSGKGLRAWEQYGNSDYNLIFSLILEHYSDNTDKREMNITRLDIAYDDFSGLIDLDNLVFETQKLNFVSRFRDWQVVAGSKGSSVNHGSTSSSVYIRIYDKKAEQQREDIEHWVRCEMQLRKNCALGFIMNNEVVDRKFFDVLNNYLRYVVTSDNVTNKSMLLTAPYWANFISSYNTTSIFYKPAFTYNFSNLHYYVTDHMSSAIATCIDIVGVNQFLVDVNNSRKNKKLNERYKSMKEQYNANSNAILEFLNERDSNNERA